MRKKVEFAIVIAAVVLLLFYSVAPKLWAPYSPRLTAFADYFQIGVGALLIVTSASNLRRSQARLRWFWLMMTFSVSLWLISQFIWTYFEVIRGVQVPRLFPGDILFFLQVVPMLGALAVKPHVKPDQKRPSFGWIDFSILFLWWIWVYVFLVSPWHFVLPNPDWYGPLVTKMLGFCDLVFTLWCFAYFVRSEGNWRKLYGYLALASLVRLVDSVMLNNADDHRLYYSGSFYDVPLMAAYFAMAWTFVHFGRVDLEPKEQSVERYGHGVWPARLAMAAVISMPVLGLWEGYFGHTPHPIRTFRIEVSLTGIIVLATMLYLKQTFQDRELIRLLVTSEKSLVEKTHLQEQLVRTEKLVALGQLVSGAAHEMNNPLTSILGYSELIATDVNATPTSRDFGTKIGQQARRTRRLVQSLLTFARQSPTEKVSLNLDGVISQSILLRHADLDNHKVDLVRTRAENLPGVRGDANQLMQLLFHLLSNAIDAIDEVGGGRLYIETRVEGTTVQLKVADSGPGLKDPSRVFDPFYTTKPVGKGTGLGLSACYGIVTEHGGTIIGRNRLQGGAEFLITLPALANPAPDESGAFRSLQAGAFNDE